MKLNSPFILLLGTVIPLSLEANAVPSNNGQRGVVTLPLKRVPHREGLHPQLVRIVSYASGYYEPFFVPTIDAPTTHKPLTATSRTHDGSPGAILRSTFGTACFSSRAGRWCYAIPDWSRRC